MPYQNHNLIIPAAKRESINNTILQLIESPDMKGITPEDIFNSYTGIGGLHGLDRHDYNNYSAFSNAKKEYENGQFFTSPMLCEFIMNILKPADTDLIADLTFGMGNFFNYCPVESNCYGIELDSNATKVAKHLYPQANLEEGDLQYYHSDIKFDLVVGNPPFNLSWNDGISQLVYCNKAAQFLKPGGLMAIITPGSFLADEYSNKSQIETIEEHFNFVCQFNLPINGFAHLGVKSFNTKLLVLQRRSEHLPFIPVDPHHFEDSSSNIFENYLLPLYSEKNLLKAKLVNELSNNEFGNNWSFSKRNDYQHNGFSYRVKKYLFEIKTHPLLKLQLSKAEQYINQFHTQVKPEDMSYKEWDKKKLTENKVLAYLLKIILLQSKKDPIEKMALVKTNYGLKIKGYSPKTKRQIKKLFKQTYFPFYDLIQFDHNPINATFCNRFPGISTKLIDRKKADFNLQSQSFDTIDRNAALDQYLNNFSFLDKKGNSCFLNNIQKNDLGLMFQKKYGSLNWEQGSGKTLAGYSYIKMLQDHNKIKNSFVIGPAIAIKGTWAPFLTLQGHDFVNVKTIEDIESIKPGQTVLVALTMLTRHEKKLQKLVKCLGNKIAMVFDESDEITNHNAIRTKSTLKVFRRAAFKLETTGTTTRNNINEWYPQLELLYNNSYNMICTCKYKYREDKKDDLANNEGIKQSENLFYNKPFPAYHGFNLFRACFNPFKKTVFGIEKQNQDIYNQQALLGLIQKTVITRKFNEVAGDGKYEIHNLQIDQNEHEEHIYFKILQEFHEIERKYCNSSGNSKKDAMLRLIKQINLLIKATSMPHAFSEYEFNLNQLLPTKFLKISELVSEKSNEKIMIGVTRKDAAEAYYRHISNLFPFRKIFLILGHVDINKRKQIIKEFEESFDGILISTQQSLKSSVNIPTCNVVILESLQWNIPKMSQYYFRAIRYDSKHKTDVYFITYNDTLEQNIMALLMNKEAINDFIKNKEYKEASEVFAEFDVDPNLLSSIITKSYDDEGKMKLSWGKGRAIAS
ncbi:MAG: helicase-related protein [Reichenbachiella sp.]|uniref:helicase-related protein n=2 Tax=Reichenbachiella sp. TaxID=2184521 RepID=UPI003299DD82